MACKRFWTVKFESKLELFGDDLWGLHFKVDDEIAQKLIRGKNRRVLCSINGSHPYHAAIMHLKPGIKFVNVNKPFAKKNGIWISDKIQVELTPDNSKYGMEMPEEFQETLNQDPIAFEYFEKLTPGKQRNLIYFVGNVKSSEIKVRRAWVVTDHLVSHKGVVDFKDLNRELKEANQNARLG